MSQTGPLVWQLLLQLCLILINALFACAEIAIISINDNKLAKLSAAGDKRALRLTKLTEHPARFLATIQVGITLAGFMASAFAASSFAGSLSALLLRLGVTWPAATLHTVAVIAITLILSYFTLVLGELVPKRIAMRKAERIALALSWLVYVIARLFAPLVWLLSASTNGILRILGIDPHAEDDEVTEEEIRMLVDEGSEKGAINASEKEMIQNVFEFDDKTAGEVMTHRTEVSLLWMDESDEQWEETIMGSRHSMYPICEEVIDNVIGVLNTRLFFRLEGRSRQNVMDKAVSVPYFVPETVRTDVLFRNMKKSRNHFAVVLDEYGGVNGIITMNDLLEQLVGELENDSSLPSEPAPIERLDSHTFLVTGSAPLNSVSTELGVMLPEDEYETFGGLVFGLLGYVPDDGSTPELKAFGLDIKVTEVKEHQLEKAVVALRPRGEDSSAG